MVLIYATKPQASATFARLPGLIKQRSFMFLSRLRLFRIPVTLVLLGLLALSILCIKNIVTSAWQSDQHEEALYLKSPGCFPRKDASEVDQSLPPCRDIMATVTAKPQNTVVDHYHNHGHPKMQLFLTLQYSNGCTQTVGDIYSDMWNSIGIGSQVSVTLWNNQVKEVAANGYSQSIFDEKKWNHTGVSLAPWIVIGLLCSTCLSLLWRLTSNRMIS
jgi:hypothetical protein